MTKGPRGVPGASGINVGIISRDGPRGSAVPRFPVIRTSLGRQGAVAFCWYVWAVSHDRMIEKRGSGGLGVVSKAPDSRLDRLVARARA